MWGSKKIQGGEKGFDVLPCPAQLMLSSAAVAAALADALIVCLLLCCSWEFRCGVHFILIIDQREAGRNQNRSVSGHSGIRYLLRTKWRSEGES